MCCHCLCTTGGLDGQRNDRAWLLFARLWWQVCWVPHCPHCLAPLLAVDVARVCRCTDASCPFALLPAQDGGPGVQRATCPTHRG